MNFVGYSEMESVIWLKNISNMIPCQICLKKEKKTLHKLITKKNCIHVINDMDKNLGPANADKSDVIKECKRQLYDFVTYLKLTKEEMEMLKKKSIEVLRRMVEHHFYLGNYSQKEK